MARICLQNLGKSYGATAAVANFTLDIADGELVSFLGPSGCGKTTTLRMIAGFIEPTAGRVLFDDMDVTRYPAHRRNAGMVFQRYALFPHMTVSQNVSFGLEMHKVPAAERGRRIREALDMVRMASLGDRYPRQLSGGQQQRVAIARALAIEPTVFLLDEPLSNLDAKLRLEVREEIRALQRRLGLTTIFVTHDQEEALAMSDRMAIMQDGIVRQVGTPDDLYERPESLFVADFLGKMNFYSGRMIRPGQFETEAGPRLAVSTDKASATRVGVRPERIGLSTEAGTGNAVPVTVEAIAFLGPHVNLRLDGPGGLRLLCQMPNTGTWRRLALAPGQQAFAVFESRDCVIFSE